MESSAGDASHQIDSTAAAPMEDDQSKSNGNNNNNSDPKQSDKFEQSDPIQNAMGHFGRWHFVICALLFLLKMPGAWHQIIIIFLAPPVAFQCADASISNCSSECPEIIYDRSVFSETIVTEWNLICGQSQWANTSQTIFMLGILLGSMLFGAWSDKYGRRSPLVTSVVIQLIAGVATSFAPWFWLFCVWRFVTAVATGGSLVVSFVLVMELVGDKWRELISIVYHIPFNIGYATLPVFAYFLRDWRFLQFAISIASVVLLSYYWLVPESPRWLVTVGRTDDAVAVLEKAARHNKLPAQAIRDSMYELAKQRQSAVSSASVARGTLSDLVRTPNMRKKTLCICFNWFAVGLSYFGVAQYIGQSDGDIFLNVAISAVMAIPGTIMPVLTMRFIGRRNTLFATTLGAGVAMILVAFLPQWQVILGGFAMVCTSMAFPTTYLFSGELFPTVVRNQGVGIASMMARIGPMIAPFIIALKMIAPALPPIILGTIPVLSAVTVLLLPETRGIPLPATVEDGENFGKK